MNTIKKSVAALVITLVVLSFISGCKKADEVPPRMPRYDKDFILPAPEFLSQEEREWVSQKRAEYNAL